VESKECTGTHRFFVADAAQVEDEGKVVIIAMCTACGQTRTTEHVVVSKNKKEK